LKTEIYRTLRLGLSAFRPSIARRQKPKPTAVGGASEAEEQARAAPELLMAAAIAPKALTGAGFCSVSACRVCIVLMADCIVSCCFQSQSCNAVAGVSQLSFGWERSVKEMTLESSSHHWG
jgi:hypothetical protein